MYIGRLGEYCLWLYGKMYRSMYCTLVSLFCLIMPNFCLSLYYRHPFMFWLIWIASIIFCWLDQKFTSKNRILPWILMRWRNTTYIFNECLSEVLSKLSYYKRLHRWQTDSHFWEELRNEKIERYTFSSYSFWHG